MQVYIDSKAFDSTNLHDFWFCGGTGLRQPPLQALHNAQHLDPLRPTVVDPFVQTLRVGNINFASFIKDMSMVWRNDVIAQLVYEHMDRLSLIKPIDDTNVSGCYASSWSPSSRRAICSSRLTAGRRWM